MSEDVAALRAELERSQQALAVLQRNFDDFHESSREIEEELEAELGRTQEEASGLERRLAEVARRLGEQQGKNRVLISELASAQAETGRLRDAAARAAVEKTNLEQSLDDFEAKCRAAIASEDDARHKLDLAIEEKIFVSNDLEDLRAETLRTERRLRAEIEDLRQEVGRLRAAAGSRTPPVMVLPKAISSTDTDDEVATVVADEDTLLRSTGDSGATAQQQNHHYHHQQQPTAIVVGSLSGDDGYPETANEAADELIKALEEEVEGLKSELREAEASNDEINEELQMLQEQLLSSSIGIGMGDGTGMNSEKSGNEGCSVGGSGCPEASNEIQGLKEELSEAMATCEELDQTVTDLTDELHTKDAQRGELADRVAMLEGELRSKTQQYEDELSKVKALASAREAEVADSKAELRASNRRLKDASSKALSSQGREEVLREKNASQRERISELSTVSTELSASISEREAQLEEALTHAESLRAEQDRLKKDVEALSVRLAEETEARRLAERRANEREALLQGELRVERAASEAASAAAAAAAAAQAEAAASASSARVTETETQAQQTDEVGVGGGDGRNGLQRKRQRHRQGEGQESREDVDVDDGGDVRDGGRGVDVGDRATGSLSSGSSAKSRREAELEQRVARLEAELKEAKGLRTGVGVGVSGDVEVALESGDVDVVKQELRSALDIYGRERVRNASLLSKIRALRGNIEVICRIRPPTAEEKAADVPIALEALGDGEVGVKTLRSGGWRSFTLDKALGPSTSQEEVFQEVEPLALSAADGMNACIFAYGQTGSGKTHTMIGDARGGEMAGVSYRTMNKLFQVLELRRSQQPQYSFTVKIAMLEIYNEEVRDLLSPEGANHSNHISNHSNHGGSGLTSDWALEGGGGSSSKLEIRRDQSGVVQVPGLTYVNVTSAGQVVTLLERGGSARAVAATGVHDHSSRSHSVLMAEVSCRAGADDLPANGRLFLVDLAGSERIKVSGVTGAGLREATNINSSLSALGDVMQALDQKQKHVPYRNSKLTFLLQDALGGNSRTAMVVTVCPTRLNVDETLFALQFAARARNVSLGPTHRNVGAKNLLEESKELRAKLREAGRKKEHAEEALATLQREHARSQQKMAALLESRSKNSGDLRQQLEQQIDSLKAQLEASQAHVLEERNKRASLQTDAEDTERQLKRSLAKVTALGRDREDREAKLRAKQEEVSELKAELRKVVSDAKNTVRRMSAGRISMGGSGSTGRRGEGEDDRISPHTPSKNLIEAKHRYTRMRQSTPAGMRSPFLPSPFTSVSPSAPPAGGEAAAETDSRVSNGNETSAESVTFETRISVGREERPLAMGFGSSSGACREAEANDRGIDERVVDSGGVIACQEGGSKEAQGAAAASTSSALAPSRRTGTILEPNGVVGKGVKEEGVEAAAEAVAAAAGGADDVADAIARATAVFAARPSSNGINNGTSNSNTGVKGGHGGDRKASGGGAKGGSVGAKSRLMRGTASSMSRVRLPSSSASADEGSRAEPPPRSGRHVSCSTPSRAGSTPRETLRSVAAPPSPATKLTRQGSLGSLALSTLSSAKPRGSFGGSGSVGGSSRPKTPRVRNSFSGPPNRGDGGGGGSSATAGAVTSLAASSSTNYRRRTMLQPPSPAHAGAASAAAGAAAAAGAIALSSSRSSTVGHGVSGGSGKGWLGEKPSRGAGGSRYASPPRTTLRASGGSQRSPPGNRAPSVAAAATAAAAAAAAGAAAPTSSAAGSAGGGQSQSRAQIALERHQARMDRIREKRQQRMGARDGEK